MEKGSPEAVEYIKLRKCHTKLLTSLDVSAQLISSLYEKGVLDENDVDKINSKDTGQEKAAELLFKIQKKYRYGDPEEGPYKKFIRALIQCDQKHIAEMLNSKQATEKDYRDYKTSFLSSEASSTSPGSPRLSVYPASTSTDSKQIKDAVNRMMNQQSNVQPTQNRLDTPQKERYGPAGQMMSVTAQHWNSDPNLGLQSGPVTMITSDSNLGSPRSGPITLVTRDPNLGPQSGPVTMVTRDSSLGPQSGPVTMVTSDHPLPMLRDEFRANRSSHKNKNPLYAPSYANSPCYHPFYIHGSNTNLATGHPVPQTFKWDKNQRNSFGVEIYEHLTPRLTPDPVYQSMESLPGLASGKGRNNVLKRNARRNRESQMTDKELNMLVEEDNDVIPDGYVPAQPMAEGHGAAVQVNDFSHSMNNIHAHAHGHAHPDHPGPNLKNITGTVNTSVLAPTTDSDGQSIDALDTSRDNILRNRRQGHNECCIVL